ncbi:MAG: hypothetical protein GF411_19215 [Candidatus Lokiarchaeota archaeon]|nr:hypothetical protein [Candidatus Lokiarchaeota archaeon]
MVDIKIAFDKDLHKPGDAITGEVIIESDEYDSYEAVRLDLFCTMKSEVSKGTGDSRRTYIDTEHIIQDKHYLAEQPQIQAGINKFPFSVELPIDVPGTYEGTNGEIVYEIRAVLEKENWIDPLVIEKLQVVWLVPRQNIESKSIHWIDEEEDYPRLEVSLDSNHLVLGEDLLFKVKVASGLDMRGLRVKIAYREEVAPKGMNDFSRDILAMIEYDKNEVMTDTWMDVRIPTSSEWPFPFLSKLIWTQYVLEVDIDVPFRTDITSRIPLLVTFPFHRDSTSTDDTVIFEWDSK